MATSIRECGVDAEIRDLLPAHSWQESAELGASVERFGYLAPLIACRNTAGELIVLDGHKRRELWLAACGAAQKSVGSLPVAPQVIELPFDSRDAAMLFVLDNATGRRNLSDLDRIKLAAKREEIVRRMARENLKTSSGGANPGLRRKRRRLRRSRSTPAPSVRKPQASASTRTRLARRFSPRWLSAHCRRKSWPTSTPARRRFMAFTRRSRARPTRCRHGKPSPVGGQP